jgi:acyl-CoA synthetase (NDP forming)
MYKGGLDALFRPASVVIIGASNDPNKVGGRPMAFLLKAGWRGRLLPVNPSAARVQGVPAHASLDAIAGPIDQAIVAVPASQVLGTVDRCLARGVRAIQVFSAGYGEGPCAAAAQAALRDKATAAGARILGPNSLGLFNTADGYFGTFATALDGAWPRTGGVGVATQSGAFGSYFFGLAQLRGLGFSHFVATGNEADVDVADCIAWMAADPHTRVIVTAMEGCRDGRKLTRALQAARAVGKPVLAMKVGASEAGARAAATHTGALSGADRVFDAVLRDAGAFRASSLSALVDAAYVASIGPMPAGRRMMVVTTSGGIGVLVADVAEDQGLALPPIGDAALADLRAIAPLADGHNPVDTSAGILGDLSAYARMAARALADTPVDSVLCFVAHIARNPAHWAQLREPLQVLRAGHRDKTFALACLADAAITAELESHGFAVFADPGAAVAALAACAPHAEGAAPISTDDTAPRARTLPPGPMSERTAKAVLAEWGQNFPAEQLVRDADEAVAAAGAIGYPVVLKIVSPDIAHKTEAGGVALGLQDEAALRLALLAMDRRVRQAQPAARIEGFLVARQLDGGIEVLVGTHTDPVFGPIVTVGAGGVLAELIDDVCVRLAPVTEAAALDMLQFNRLGRLLKGVRGAAPADLHALASQIACVSQAAWAHRGEIEAIDLNPVLARPDGAFALDALIVTHGRPA